MKRLLALFGVAFLLTISVCGTLTMSASAVDIFPGCASGAKGENTVVCKDVNAQATAKTNPIINTIKTVIEILSYVVGVAAIIGLVVSGLRMILSNGDPASMASARSGILYSLIGIVVTVLAQTIVVFVLDKIK